MPYSRNITREKTLLRYWMIGKTVKEASFLSGVPEGSISHYYARFNRDKEKYRKIFQGKYQERQYSNPESVAIAALSHTKIIQEVGLMVQKGEYGKARDFLEICLLLPKVLKQSEIIMRNYDPNQFKEVLQHLFNLSKFIA